MLFTKDVKVIKSKDKKSYVAYTFDKPNFEARENDPVKDYTPKTDGKMTVLQDGTEFKGTQLKNEVAAGITETEVKALLDDAIVYGEVASQAVRRNKKGEIVANPYTLADGKPVPFAGTLYLLACFTESITAHLRLELDAENREQTIDMAAVRYSQVKLYIKAAKDKGKELSEAKAYLKVAKAEAMELIEAAEDAGEELDMDDALLSIDWYQDMLAKQPVLTT